MISTTTPAEEIGEFVNDLDPAIELFDPNGVLVASNDNGVPDGRNALLNFVAPADGTYTLVIGSTDRSTGIFALTTAGPVLTPLFSAFAQTPDDGVLLNAYPTSYRVIFSQNVLLTSLDASDLTVDGVPARGVSVVDGRTLEFDITTANQGDGLYEVAIAAGALTSVSGQPIETFTATFDADATDPIVDSRFPYGKVFELDKEFNNATAAQPPLVIERRRVRCADRWLRVIIGECRTIVVHTFPAARFSLRSKPNVMLRYFKAT